MTAQTVAAGDTIFVAYEYRIEGDEQLKIGFAGRTGASGWKSLTSPPFPASESSATVMAADGTKPCIGGSSAAGPIVSCFDGQEWSAPLTIDAAGWKFNSMETIGGRLYALAANQRSLHRVWVKSGDQFIALPGTVGGAIGVLGRSASQPLINTEVNARGATKREIWAPNGTGWSRIGSSKSGGLGPQTRGSIKKGRSIYLSVTSADRMPWQFSVLKGAGHRWESVTRRALNISRGGSAQGRLAGAGGTVWAIWQENDQRSDGYFDSLYAVRAVSRKGSPKVLWRGRSVGPGDIDMVSVRGETWVMYLPARSKQNPKLGIRFKRIA